MLNHLINNLYIDMKPKQNKNSLHNNGVTSITA